jgi:hypothetical protein
MLLRADEAAILGGLGGPILMSIERQGACAPREGPAVAIPPSASTPQSR